MCGWSYNAMALRFGCGVDGVVDGMMTVGGVVDAIGFTLRREVVELKSVTMSFENGRNGLLGS
jgi:hypothetical protein